MKFKIVNFKNEEKTITVQQIVSISLINGNFSLKSVLRRILCVHNFMYVHLEDPNQLFI